MAWWNRHSGVLENEIQALETAGMQPTKDEKSFAEGRAVIHIHLEVLGSGRDAIIIYPDLFPYFRPTFHVPGLGHGLRHYNPCLGEVCLLRRGTERWQPSMTAAQHIRDMLPQWEHAAVRGYEDPRLEGEDTQAEPATVYYPAISSQLVVMDSSWLLPTGLRSGLIKLAFPKGYRSISPSEIYTAWVTGIQDQGKKAIDGISFSNDLNTWLKGQNYEVCLYPWIRLNAPPSGRTTEELTNAIASSDPVVAKHILREIQNCRSGLYGFCFPEEAPGGGNRDGWLFLAYHFDLKAKRRGEGPTYWVIKTDHAGEKDLFERVPELAPLRHKTVAVVGLGCVGAPSVLALARAGIGELRLLDGDHVSAGTTCRWPLGLTAAGGGKVRELAQFVMNNYPLTRIGTDHYPGRIEDCRVTIGACEDGYDQWECLDKLVKGADLIYDATAELGINQLLCELATLHNVPYITVSARAGGWGGNVVRVRPDNSGGCFLCYLHALEDGEFPQPPYDPHSNELQPVGCGDITFKAAGFDVEEISLAGVRMAVSTLCEGVPGGYPPISHDVGILFLRDQTNGELISPQWHAASLHRHPKCRICNK